MKLLYLLSLAAVTIAFPSQTRPYKKPGAGDSRSPCPGLNALANHGYLPHNGRGITGPQMIDAFSKAMNFQTNISQTAVNANFLPLGLDPVTSVVDLEDFFVPNVTDHRCSVARDDYQHPLNPHRIALAVAQGGGKTITPQIWGKSRVAIEHLTTNPPPYSNDIAAGEGTAGLMFLSVSQDSRNNGDYANVQARKDWLTVFMQDEFPIKLGWKPQVVQPTIDDLVGITGAITAARTQVLNSH
ncbi:Chloroperoxidase [Xylogone sp. PMI_703]|nr:Chloroperoxidase [Xylogone sp. PMI_703]